MKSNILIVDDEQSICTFLEIALEDEFEVFTVNAGGQAMELLEKKHIHLVLLDLMLGKESGLDVLSRIRGKYPDTAVIMMTAFGDIHSSVEAIKRGAFHYLCKPIDLEELLLYIHQALEFQHLSQRVESLRSELEELEQRTYFGEIIGKSPQMQRIYQLIDKVRTVDSSVVITGESGTGKELVARAIHRSGVRAKENFVSVNCAAIPEGLLEEEFFGHVKGSFTGAVADKKGKLQLADHGTLFLDEVGDMPLSLQGKLLRVLQEKEMMPIGATAYKKVDVRVICATNRDLQAMVQAGTFRNDLYYRLHVIAIHMPPLRERKQDIPDLCRTFLKRLSENSGRKEPELDPSAERVLLEYAYPGNVRELFNILEYASIVCTDGRIRRDDLPEDVLSGNRGVRKEEEELSPEQAVRKYLKGMSIREMERLLIQSALEENPQSNRAAARQLGISERSLYYKLQEYKI